MSGILEWAIFLALSLVAIVMAASMILTMSMYRAGLALMASFVALAGLFILLDADLLAAIQIMMNVGGMLIMVLFMVMIMMDPGGEMMWDMKRKMHLPGLAAFSMHMPRGKPPEEPTAHHTMQGATSEQITYTCPMHPEVQQELPGKCPKCGMRLIEADDEQSKQAHEHMDMPMNDAHGSTGTEEMAQHKVHDMSQMLSNDSTMNMEMPGHDMSSGHDMDMSSMQNMPPRQNYEMMMDMAMSTAQLPWAILLGVVSALLLIALVVKTAWPVSSAIPTLDASREVGVLLLSRYMIGFEGAAFLIVAGIAGAVLLGKREHRRFQDEEEPDKREVTRTDGKAADDEKIYTCPMHADVREHHMGNCPTCGMQLVPVEEAANAMHEHMQGGHS